MPRLASRPTLKLRPRNFRSATHATALFASLTLSLSRRRVKLVTLPMTRFSARSLAT